MSVRTRAFPRTETRGDDPVPPDEWMPALARPVTLAWHGVNDGHNLRAFIRSEIRWAELDIRRDPDGRLVLRHDRFDGATDDDASTLADTLEVLRWHTRAVKLDLKEREILEDVVREVGRFGFGDGELWWNATIETLGREGFRRLRRERPGSTIQCPIDTLVPLLLTAPTSAEEALATVRTWGIDRVSIDWRTGQVRETIDELERLGWPVNVYGVPDLDAFLEAARLLPTSLTADFNFPRLRYDGRGPRRHAIA